MSLPPTPRFKLLSGSLAVFATLALLASPILADIAPRSKVKRFVLQVTLGAEYGSNKNVASRWTKPPTVSVFGATADQKAVIAEVIRTVNASLLPILGEIQVLPDNTATATLKVFFAPLRDLARVARENNASYVQGNWGYFWMFWDGQNAMTSAGVLLASDKLSGDKLKHFAHEEIIQSLGLAQDSDEFSDSIFYQRGSDGGSATRPSALDLQLLAWYYQHVTPGDDRKAVSDKFEASWPKTK